MKLKYLFSIVILMSIFNCARRGNPTGGIKDENSPIIINTIPSHNSLNFDKDEIRIYFDEYIKLKDVQTQLVISPPLKYNPIISPLSSPSKRLTIKIEDTLKVNTTYVFNFGESIEDNNEGNKLSDFKYIFSTGNYIDTLNIKGSIKDAYNKKADKFVSVLLYEVNENYNDSIIFKEKPNYITNTLDKDSWEITNIKKGKYRVIALKESQKNYIYNSKQDKIAFIDSIITIPTEKDFQLKLFRQRPDFKLERPIEISKGHLIFGFKGDGKSLKISAFDKNIQTISFFEKQKDTLHFFYNGKDLDSIKIRLENKDFLEESYVKLRLKKLDSLLLKNTINNTLFLRDTISFTSNNPITTIDTSKITLTDKDTINVPFTTKIDKRKNLKILFKQSPNNKYKLTLLPNAVKDFFNQTNDSLNYNFITKKETYYGSFKLKIETLKFPIIVQLLSERGNLIEEIYTDKNQDFNFENLRPAKYNIRVIIDSNKNKKWDTGDFIKNLQPENVYYFNKTLEIKENWFLNETFIIK